MLPKKKYDVVIIGSGMGGLMTGAILAKEGLKVCILEKNEQIGGNLQTFKRDEVVFDTGVHYIGSLGENQTLFKLFKYVNIWDRLALEPLSENGFDVIHFAEEKKSFAFKVGYENFIQSLTNDFPHQKENIENYCSEIKRFCKNFPLYNLEDKDEYDDLSMLSVGAKDKIEELIEDKLLQKVLAGNNLLYAGVADKTPFYIHAMVMNSYIEGSFRCKEGSDQIAHLLAREIKKQGGDIFRNTTVVKFNELDGVINNVEDSEGNLYYAQKFISNIHPASLMEKLQTNLIRKVSKQRIKLLENSVSVFSLYLVLKKNSWKNTQQNHYHFTTKDVWNSTEYKPIEWPKTYALYEFEDKTNPAFCAGLGVLTYMKFEEVADWHETRHTTRNKNERVQSYQQFKREKEQILLARIEIDYPGICAQIAQVYSSTPLTQRDYLGNIDGNIYGIIKDFNNPISTKISHKTKIPNLFMVGQNIGVHGILGVCINAILVSSEFIDKKELLQKIKEVN